MSENGTYKPDYRKMCRQIARMTGLHLVEYGKTTLCRRLCGLYNGYCPILIVECVKFKNPSKEVYPAILEKYHFLPSSNEWGMIDVISNRYWREGLSRIRDTYIESGSNTELQIVLDATVGDVD